MNFASKPENRRFIMSQFRVGKELLISTKNKIGILLHISRVLSSEGINIEAISAHAAGNFALIGLITETNAKAIRILKREGYDVVENSVLIASLENKTGVLKKLTTLLAKSKLDLFNMYGGSHPKNSDSILVFSTTDNQEALSVLKKAFN